jgi:hypothetical protein
MSSTMLSPLKDCDFDDPPQPDCGNEKHDVEVLAAKNEARPRPRDGAPGTRCVARPSRDLSNVDIADREDLTYADFMRSIPSFGRPDLVEGFDDSDIVADDDCFVYSRTCRMDEFNNRVMRQAKYNMFEPEKIQYGFGIDSRREIRDTRCKKN